MPVAPDQLIFIHGQAGCARLVHDVIGVARFMDQAGRVSAGGAAARTPRASPQLRQIDAGSAEQGTADVPPPGICSPRSETTPGVPIEVVATSGIGADRDQRRQAGTAGGGQSERGIFDHRAGLRRQVYLPQHPLIKRVRSRFLDTRSPAPMTSKRHHFVLEMGHDQTLQAGRRRRRGDRETDAGFAQFVNQPGNAGS